MKESGVMGIYRLYDQASGTSFVGFSHHMEAAKKRLLFELKLNACANRPLQAFYNEKGSLAFEVLKEYHPAPGEDPLETDARLMVYLLHYKETLPAKLIQTPV